MILLSRYSWSKTPLHWQHGKWLSQLVDFFQFSPLGYSVELTRNNTRNNKINVINSFSIVHVCYKTAHTCYGCRQGKVEFIFHITVCHTVEPLHSITRINRLAFLISYKEENSCVVKVAFCLPNLQLFRALFPGITYKVAYYKSPNATY